MVSIAARIIHLGSDPKPHSVGERSNLTLSTLEFAKAWGDAGLGHKNDDLKKSTSVSSTVSVFAMAHATNAECHSPLGQSNETGKMVAATTRDLAESV